MPQSLLMEEWYNQKCHVLCEQGSDPDLRPPLSGGGNARQLIALRCDTQRSIFRRHAANLVAPGEEDVVYTHVDDAISSDPADSSDYEKKMRGNFTTAYWSRPLP